MFNIRWLSDLGASPATIIVFMMGILFAAFVMWFIRYQLVENRALRAEIKDARDDAKDDDDKITESIRKGNTVLLAEIKDVRRDTNKNEASIWTEIKQAKETVSRLDALSYGTAIAVQVATKIKLINQSADGDGNYSLHRDIE